MAVYTAINFGSSAMTTVIASTSATVQMMPNTRYIAEYTFGNDFNLPATSNLGDVVIVDNLVGAPYNVLITQFNSMLQQIRFGVVESTAGNTGGLNSNTMGDSVTLTSISNNNTLWLAEATIGATWELI